MGWIEKGETLFNRATDNGTILWQNQKTAYIAGFGEGDASTQKIVDLTRELLGHPKASCCALAIYAKLREAIAQYDSFASQVKESSDV